MGAGLVLLLVMVAGLVGYIAADGGGDGPTGAKPVTASSTVAASKADGPVAPTKAPGRQVVPDLRKTLDAFADAGEKSANTGSPTFKEILSMYAVPACGAILGGFADAFGGEDESGDFTPSDVVSVEQDGNKGRTVTREVGSTEHETVQWLYDGTAWHFTCEGILDDNTTLEAEPAATTPTEAPRTVYPDKLKLGDQCPHSRLNSTGTSETGAVIRCLANAEGDYVWQTDTGVTQEDPAIAGQDAWGKCLQAGNTTEQCREIVDGN